MRQLFIWLFAIACLACNNAANTDKEAKSDDKSVKAESGSKNIRNDVKIETKGLTVQQAFLMFEDGRLVPQDNKVDVGQRVNLRLIVEGWEPVNGKVLLGASEKITTDEGQVVLDEADLFNTLTEGVNPADAGVITLTAVITRVDKLFKYFEVAFRVWDKNSQDNITGSYRLYLK